MRKLLIESFENNISDIHLSPGFPPIIRINGELKSSSGTIMNNQKIKEIFYEFAEAGDVENFARWGECDFSYSEEGVGRMRVNVFKQMDGIGMAIRLIKEDVLGFEALGLPEILKNFASKRSGLFLIAGAAGVGKSTTAAAMIDFIARERGGHIITLEDPIEYKFKHHKAIINQRSVGDNTKSFAKGLRSALRQDPDVIYIGELRDTETIEAALTAAETGHLVIATMHSRNVPAAVNRIVNAFPETGQEHVRMLLAESLCGIVVQQLIKSTSGRRMIPAFEIMTATVGVRNLIRDGKSHQLSNLIQTGNKQGMISMEFFLAELVKKKLLTIEQAQKRCLDEGMFLKYLRS